MKKTLFALAAAVALTGCSHAVPVVVSPLAASAPLDAQATDTLMKGYTAIYTAIFTRLDASQDNRLDEYEASAAIDVADFGKADKNKDGKLTKAEFMSYATGGTGVFGFMHQSKDAFLKQSRDALLKAFTKLDKNKDRYLDNSELSDDALQKVDVYLRIDPLHVNVHIQELDDDLMEKADHTGDGKLTQAEWEDYCLSAFTKMVNPSSPAPAADDSGDDGSDGN